ncbi:LytR/AlgR family response regulator transcription factor [Bacteroidota bacterium]
MSQIKILIIEDELIIAEDIKLLLGDLDYQVVDEVARTYEDGLRLFESENPDLVLVDIIISGAKDGIELAEAIRERTDIPLIFLTSHADSYTVDRAKKMNPDAYIVKPFEKTDLYSSIEIAIHNFSTRNSDLPVSDAESGLLMRDAIFVKKDYRLFKINISDIRWLKSDGNYIEIHCTSTKHLVRSSLKDFMTKLPADHFLQVHKSFAINTDYLDSLDYATIQIGEDEIPVGRKYLETIKKFLNVDL